MNVEILEINEIYELFYNQKLIILIDFLQHP